MVILKCLAYVPSLHRIKPSIEGVFKISF